MAHYDNWLFHVKDHCAMVTLNRAESMNDLTIEGLHELKSISEHLAARSDVWVVVLQGSGEHFSSGIDPHIITDRLEQPVPGLDEFVRDQQRCLDALDALDKVKIAKIKGFCIGGGLLISLCCDFRIASKRTIFSLPEIRLGIPILWGTQRLTRVVGIPKTKEMIMLGKRYRADDAYQMGLVHQVVVPQKLDQTVDALVSKFLRLPPRSVAIAKRIIEQGANLSMRESQKLEIDALMELADSPDLREAIESYLDKRKPEFIGE